MDDEEEKWARWRIDYDDDALWSEWDEYVRQQRLAQGLPETIEDKAFLEQVAAFMRASKAETA